MFISGKRGGFVHPSPATEKMRPRYRAGDDKRGGRAVFVFQLVFACCLHAPPNSQIRNRFLLINTGGEVMLHQPPAAEERGSAKATTSAGGESRFVFNWCLFVACTRTSQTSEMVLFFSFVFRATAVVDQELQESNILVE